MSGFDGSGDFVIGGTGLPFVTNTTISSTVANQLNTDIANGLSNTICKDGQSTPTNDIPMGGFKVTDVGDPTAPGDALTYGAPATIGDLTVTGDVSLTQAIEQNLVLAGPIVDPAAPPTFRLLAPADIPGGAMSGRNKLINGDMRIDEYNRAALVSPALDGGYVVDRWRFNGYNANTFSTQQLNAIGSFPFNVAVNSYIMAINTISPSTILGGYYNIVCQLIEYANFADLQWGTNYAQPVTLSFLVYANKAGWRSGSISNSDASRAITFGYNVPTANLFTKIVITLPGCVDGSWFAGMRVAFDLGSDPGAHYTAAGVWNSGAFYTGIPGSLQLASELNGELAFAEVQLELAPPGATPSAPIATSFDRRPFGQEFLLCRRHFQRYDFQASQLFCTGQCVTAAQALFDFHFDQPMRVAPTIGMPTSGLGSGQITLLNAAGGNPPAGYAITATRIDPTMCRMDCNGASGLVAGNASMLGCGSGTVSFLFHAEM